MNRFKQLIYRLGSKPQQSWRDFQIGLGLFAISVMLILLGAKSWYWLQIPGLLFLVCGFFFAARGYLGIFANRFAQTFNQVKPPSAEDK